MFPGVRAKAKRIGDDFSMMLSRTRLEVRSQYNFRSRGVNAGRTTSSMGDPTTSWGRNVVVYACCSGGSMLPATLSASVHGVERPRRLQFAHVFRMHFFFHVLILFGHYVQNTLENELISIYDLRFRFCLDMPLGTAVVITPRTLFSDCSSAENLQGSSFEKNPFFPLNCKLLY